MAELELVRLHDDGERLVLRAPDGTEHALPITDALRTALRGERARVEEPPRTVSPAQATMRPRDLQTRLRAGATAEELAAESGLPVEHVRRYEWPVVAERQHVIGQVRVHRIDGASDTTLGEAADARLAARGVPVDDATWSARREGIAPWIVEVRFSAGDRERSARWTFDPRGRVVTPLDDEARWLGQPDDPLSPEMIGVPSLTGRGPSRLDAGRRQADPATEATALLLDDLAGRRGQRPAGRTTRRLDDGHRDEDLSLGEAGPAPRPATGAVPRVPRPVTGPVPVARVPAPWGDDPGASHPSRAHGTPHDEAPRVEEAPGAAVVDLGSRRARPAPPHDASPQRADEHREAPGGVDEPPVERPVPTPAAAVRPEPAPVPAARDANRAAPAARRPARKGRAQVPSWDEIVFGGGRPSK
jgi:hypothetical protein